MFISIVHYRPNKQYTTRALSGLEVLLSLGALKPGNAIFLHSGTNVSKVSNSIVSKVHCNDSGGVQLGKMLHFCSLPSAKMTQKNQCNKIRQGIIRQCHTVKPEHTQFVQKV